jgi:hypothetical protein
MTARKLCASDALNTLLMGVAASLDGDGVWSVTPLDHGAFVKVCTILTSRIASSTTTALAPSVTEVATGFSAPNFAWSTAAGPVVRHARACRANARDHNARAHAVWRRRPPK